MQLRNVGTHFEGSRWYEKFLFDSPTANSFHKKWFGNCFDVLEFPSCLKFSFDVKYFSFKWFRSRVTLRREREGIPKTKFLRKKYNPIKPIRRYPKYIFLQFHRPPPPHPLNIYQKTQVPPSMDFQLLCTYV